MISKTNKNTLFLFADDTDIVNVLVIMSALYEIVYETTSCLYI